MHSLLEQIFEKQSFTNSGGETVALHSHTVKPQCEFLQRIIKENKFKKGIEIGLAYGISSLAILEALRSQNGRHTVIDKFQHQSWGGNGLDLIKQAGYGDQLEFHEAFCYEVLPKLMNAGKQYDFAYIDSTKQFDWILVDFFYLDKLIETGGVIVFDDVSFPGISKVLRYISQWPNYKIYGQWPKNKKQKQSKKLNLLLKVLPKLRKYIREDALLTNYDLGINAHCIALQKTGDDTRNWDWHKSF